MAMAGGVDAEAALLESPSMQERFAREAAEAEAQFLERIAALPGELAKLDFIAEETHRIPGCAPDAEPIEKAVAIARGRAVIEVARSVVAEIERRLGECGAPGPLSAQ